MDELKTKTEEDKEWSINVERNLINGEYVNSTSGEGIQEGVSLNESTVLVGNRILGSIHTHPRGTYPMFSWQDLNLLLNTYDETSNSFKEDAFIMIVNDDGTVYALQVTDFDALNNRINLVDWARAELSNLEIDNYFEKDFQDLYATADGDFEKAFLSAYGDSGFTLSKATSEDLDNWDTITLNNDGNVIYTPCD